MTAFVKDHRLPGVARLGSANPNVGAQGLAVAPVYYPACTANLTILFDEALLVDGASLPKPQTPNDVAGRVSAQVGKAVQEAIAAAGGLQPIAPSGSSQNLSHVYNIVPKSGTIDLPGYRQAGHYTLQFAWQDIPIDPRAIRAMAVDVFAGTVSQSDFAAGMTQAGGGVRPSLFMPNGPGGFASDDNLLITGPVDEIDVDHETSIITLEGRDDRGILLDSPVQAELLAKIDLKHPINQVVQAIVDLHPRQDYIDEQGKHGKRFNVEPVVAAEWPKGVVPSPAEAGNVTAFRVGVASGKAMQSPQGQPEKLSFWDVITNYCFLVGAIPYFTNRTIKVRPARSIFDLASAGSQGSTIPTPFAGGARRTVQTDSGPDSFGVRRLVYGRDIHKLHLARKCGGTQTPVVTVVSFDPASTSRGKGKLIKVTHPSRETIGPGASADLTSAANKVSAAQQSKHGAHKLKPAKDLKAAQRTATSADGAKSETQEIRISVPGISSKKQLIEIARNLYEEIGRQEIGGSCGTRELASFGGDNGDPDLLRLRPGDAVQLLVDQRALSSRLPGVAPLSDLTRMGFPQAVAAIKQRLGITDDNLARAMVASVQQVSQQFSTYFRVANVKFAWSKQGMAVDFDFQNYVQVRSQLDPSPGAR